MSEERKTATIYDVAELAGVSPSTVSRAFSRPGRVSAKTVERIRAVADKLGYRSKEVSTPSLPSRTKVIGVVVTDITNPFNFRVIRGCQTMATKSGFVTALADSQESEELERIILRRMLPLIDGLVIVSTRLSDTELRGYAKQLPVVVLNRRVQGLRCIVPDMGCGVRMAVEHLTELGHMEICYLAGPEASWADGMRWRTIREASHELGFSERRLGPFAPTIQGGLSAAEQVVKRGFRAVIAYNDVMAFGLLRGLADRGIRVPDDVSVIGFDDIFAAELISPALTTVTAPLSMLGERAIRDVLAQLSSRKQHDPLPVVVPVRLVVRNSTAPVFVD